MPLEFISKARKWQPLNMYKIKWFLFCSTVSKYRNFTKQYKSLWCGYVCVCVGSFCTCFTKLTFVGRTQFLPYTYVWVCINSWPCFPLILFYCQRCKMHVFQCLTFQCICCFGTGLYDWPGFSVWEEKTHFPLTGTYFCWKYSWL